MSMSDHLVVHADQPVKPEEAAIRPGQPVHEATGRGPFGKQPEMVGSSSSMEAKVVVEEENEEVPLIGVAECRICQEDDSLNNLESPCACSGSLKVNAYTPYHVLTLHLSLVKHEFQLLFLTFSYYCPLE